MKIKLKFLLWLFGCWLPSSSIQGQKAPIDLNQYVQHFVLETKQIQVPGYPTAFNPSIVRWKNENLLSFRIRDPLTSSTDGIGLIRLDDHFDPVGKPSVLQIIYETPLQKSYAQDPRLITDGNDLYMLFSNLIDFRSKAGEPLRRMYAVRILEDSGRFFAFYPEALTHYSSPEPRSKEKNWFPFFYQGRLLLGYSISPLTVLEPAFHNGICQTVSCTNPKLSWKWGEPRGGTPALPVNKEYLAFFHSSKDLTTIQSNGKKITHYFFGAISFTASPPFAVARISPEPIVGNDFYSGPEYPTWKPLRVVFPGGYLLSENYVWVVFGKQDHELWVVKLDKYQLLDSLIPVEEMD